MPDFSLCRNEECPLKYQCLRYTAEPKPIYQSYHNYEFVVKIGLNEPYCNDFKKNTNNIMNKQDVVKILKQYNEWRRGSEIPQPNPKLIGEVIDEAIKIIENEHNTSNTGGQKRE